MNVPAVTRSLACLLALSALGCSDPPPRPASIGFTVTFQNPTVETGNRNCPTPAITYEVGNPGPLARNAGGRLEDGSGGAEITCTIKGKGDGPYNISVEGGGDSRATNSMGKHLTINGIAGAVTRGVASTLNQFSVFTPDTQGLNTAAAAGVNPASQSCSVSTLYQIGAGLIHADFACPALIGNSNIDACSASGTFVFEYCQVE
jgi:hypothetical protein